MLWFYICYKFMSKVQISKVVVSFFRPAGVCWSTICCWVAEISASKICHIPLLPIPTPQVVVVTAIFPRFSAFFCGYRTGVGSVFGPEPLRKKEQLLDFPWPGSFGPSEVSIAAPTKTQAKFQPVTTGWTKPLPTTVYCRFKIHLYRRSQPRIFPQESQASEISSMFEC